MGRYVVFGGLGGLGEVDPRLTDPLFSAREAAKQLVLLEDHLAVPAKACPDCVQKHLMAAEAFCEEACQLDPRGEHPFLREYAALVRGASTPEAIRDARKRLSAELRRRGWL